MSDPGRAQHSAQHTVRLAAAADGGGPGGGPGAGTADALLPGEPDIPDVRSRPAAARRYLLETETLQFAVRRHWAVLARAGSVYALIVVLVTGLLVAAAGHGGVEGFALVVLLAATAWFGWRVADWRAERFTVTDRRVLLVTGLLTRRVAIMPLRKVTDLTYERSITGRLLGFGAFVMESAGQHQALSRVDYLPQPDRLYQEMSNLLFGSDRANWDPDEDDPSAGSGAGPARRTPVRPDRRVVPRPQQAQPARYAPPTDATRLTAPLPPMSREPAAGRLPRGRVPRGRRQP